jgi:murein DD-endopeptidase MepM/ murein hydrolase activator NlpD
MFAELNHQQVSYIESFLQNKGLEYEPLQEEMLDHICCMIETRMSEGETFHQASKQVFDHFRKDELKEIQDQTIQLLNQKSWTMKKMTLLLFGLMLTAVTLTWAINFDPPKVSPLGEHYEITSGYGMRMHPILRKKKKHIGVDFKAPIGTPVLATADGVIEKVENLPNAYGQFIIIKHDGHYQTLYAQLSEIKVDVGQKVKSGEIIGLSGNSGMSTAPHLHYEVIKDGEHVDPEKYFGP